MKREFFNQQFAALAGAYTIAQKMADEAQDVYWEMLKDIPEDKFAKGVRFCLANNKFFPTIAELGDASLPPKKIRVRRADRFVAQELSWYEQLGKKKEIASNDKLAYRM